MDTSERASILSIEDHPLFAAGMSDLLRLLFPEFNLTSVPGLLEARQWLDTHQPAAIIADLNLKDAKPAEVLDYLLTYQQDALLVLATGDNRFIAENNLREDARVHVLPKMLSFEKASEELLNCFQKAGLVKPNEEGRVENLAERLARKTTENENVGKDLTPKQVEVMEFVSLGLTNKEIARNLNVSPETIKHHLKEAFERLNVNSRSQAVAVFRKLGIKG
jgi:DNA-binding NarL/FixJ family response regulator